MIKKIAGIFFYITIPIGVFLLLGFAMESNKDIPCRSFTVNVYGDSYFLDSSHVINTVYSKFGQLEGKKLREISLSNIEDMVRNIYFVKESQVYRTIDGDIVVNVKQREPVARIINAHNESFYIDTRGRLMKTSDQYTARVVIVTGHIAARYSSTLDLYAEKDPDEITPSKKILKELNELVHYIRNNPFWDAWIDQIYVTRTGDFELMPKNGAHVIEFGKAEDIDKKFQKLLLFYQNGLTHVGWSSYSRLNLKFKNQIVCSK
jgi:cell division protein FtsQ